jgi:hypothetical protein
MGYSQGLRMQGCPYTQKKGSDKKKDKKVVFKAENKGENEN